MKNEAGEKPVAPSFHRTTAQWNPADYAANSAVQLAWAREVMARLQLQGDERILDVGCGDGKITAELAQAVPRGSVTGIDASAAMIEFARGKFPGLEFQVMDARHLHFARSFDLVFSNSAMHWVDDQAAFLRGAGKVLCPGGRLVVLCGGRGNAQEMTVALHSVIRRKRWRDYFRDMAKPYFFYSLKEYRAWLERANFKVHQLNLTPKDACYEGSAGLQTWLRTAWLPYTQRVPEAERGEFIGAAASCYLATHPPDAGGRVAVRMMRLEIDAVKQ